MSKHTYNLQLLSKNSTTTPPTFPNYINFTLLNLLKKDIASENLHILSTIDRSKGKLIRISMLIITALCWDSTKSFVQFSLTGQLRLRADIRDGAGNLVPHDETIRINTLKMTT